MSQFTDKEIREACADARRDWRWSQETGDPREIVRLKHVAYAALYRWLADRRAAQRAAAKKGRATR